MEYSGINFIDWIVIIGYIAFLIWLGIWLGSKQNSTEEYFVGARSLTWPVIGISAMATQLSAISFISAPGFVGLKAVNNGGGTLWLSLEFAVPLAMLILIMVIYPVFYRAKIVTIYEYLNSRFDSSTRLAISLVFQLGRFLATGITIYATAIVFQTAFNMPQWITLLIISVVTIVYATTGGIKAVIYADVIQMVIIFAGIILCAVFGLQLIGGWETFITHLEPARLQAVDFNEWGYKGNHEYGFWPMLFGGLFLYLSYYGCDQTQSQRLVSSKDTNHLNISLVFNGLARFPMVLAYCVMGLIVGVFAVITPEFMSEIPRTVAGVPKPDFMLPTFIVHYLPHGIIGLLLVAVLSAAMSSISGTLNSLSAATLKDIVIPYFKKDMDDNTAYKWSLFFTFFWGVICTILALLGDKFADTAIEAINKIGSLFYGSILSVFILGICTKRTNGFGVKVGLVLGVMFNAYLWQCVPDLSWLWWNVTGFAITTISAYAISLLSESFKKTDISKIAAFQWGILLTTIWGVICFALSMASTTVSADLLKVILQAGSMLFGSIIGIFMITVANKKTNSLSAITGVVLGIIINIYLWLQVSGVFWYLWLLSGLLITILTGLFLYRFTKIEQKDVDELYFLTKEKAKQEHLGIYATILIAFFIIIILFSISLQYMHLFKLDGITI